MDWSTKDSGNIQIWSIEKRDGRFQDNQLWRVILNKDGTVSLMNRHSGRFLDCSGGESKNGTNIQQYTSNGTDSQKWTLERSEDAYWILRSELNPNMVLDVSGGADVNGTNVQLWSINLTPAQEFTFIRVGEADEIDETIGFECVSKGHNVEYCKFCGSRFSDLDDFCIKCHSYRLHNIEAPYYFREIGTPAYHQQPNIESENVMVPYCAMHYFTRVRNEHGELWFGTRDNAFIHSSNVAFDFCSNASMAQDDISNTGVLSLGDFLTYFVRDGKYDVKSYYNLGNTTYKVLIDNQHVIQMSGEDLGNTLYAYVAQKAGLSLELALYGGGLEGHPIKTLVAASYDDLSKADDMNDLISECLGFQYAETGEWKDTIQRSFIIKHPKAKDIYDYQKKTIEPIYIAFE
jgi:hypothetical protein